MEGSTPKYTQDERNYNCKRPNPAKILAQVKQLAAILIFAESLYDVMRKGHCDWWRARHLCQAVGLPVNDLITEPQCHKNT